MWNFDCEIYFINSFIWKLLEMNVTLQELLNPMLEEPRFSV